MIGFVAVEGSVVDVDLVVDLVFLGLALGSEEFYPEDYDVEVVSFDCEDEFPICHPEGL